MNPDPRLVDAIRSVPSYLRVPLLTTALIESGGRLDAVGDGGNSHGPYQENRYGRGSGIPTSSSRDPVASTKRALREFKTFYERGYRGAELAYAAQRPADKGNYLSKYQQYVDDAQRILGSGGGSGGARPKGAKGGKGADPHAGHDHGVETTTTTDTYGRPSLTDDTVGAIQSFIRSSEEAVLRGYDQPDPYQLLSTIQLYRPVQRSVSTAAGPTDPTSPPRTGSPAEPEDVSGTPGSGVVKGSFLGSPVPGQRAHTRSTHPTAGLDGYPAFDYMAPAGTKTVAPVSGTIIRLSGKDPKAGGPPGGALGYSIYLKGTNGKTYFLTHLDKPSVRAGQKVRQGQQIAVVADGPPSWSSPHVHMGVNG